ncbi:aspartyl-phosphate phosphatase Spo0E family protein [Gorillibacterium sp. CAU 1737]|uniref:aspartyl-phosphate phosphatase Spo0E family protein n=1 Tax=Gorillibacterium sp. CAU 1737 TaxID=3140362 RepID=UPI0032601F11
MELSRLSEQIEMLRQQLNLFAGKRDPLTHPHVVRISQELDLLIVTYYEMTQLSA